MAMRAGSSSSSRNWSLVITCPAPGKCERHRSGADGDQHVPGLNALPANLDRITSGEARLAVKGIDAVFRVSLFLFLRDGIGEGTLEGDELGPANPELAGYRPDRACVG